MKIGLVVAMEKELAPLLELCGEYEITSVMGNNIYTFKGYPDIVAVQSGVGEIRAAMATTLLLSVYQVEHIINYGYVGAYCETLRLGQIVNVTSVVHSDFNLSVFGNQPGQYDGMNERAIAADALYFEHLGYVQKQLTSSDNFLDPGPERDVVIQSFGANVSDMEGAGIAVTCQKAGKPFSMLKCVSNELKQTSDDYMKFSYGGIKECTKVIFETVFKQ